MPGNPKECREHAANCRSLAEQTSNPSAKEAFTSLANHWERLASELESAEAFLLAMAATEPKKASTSGLRPRRKET
jgi:hypothetical protein